MGSNLRTIGHKLKPSIRRGPVAVREKRADPFYLSPEWKALMRHIIKVRGRRCEDPKHDPATPRDGVRLYGDHIDEIEDGGSTLDPTNVMLRCGPCHGRKTAEARAAGAVWRDYVGQDIP
jgi:5-methylcytosine-specific restriction enzyme A